MRAMRSRIPRTIPLEVLESTQDPDRVLMTGVSEINNRCCPATVSGTRSSPCFVEGRGNAYPYQTVHQRLVGALGDNGIGCPNIDSERVTPEQVAECSGRSTRFMRTCGASDCSCLPIEGTGELACGKCVNISGKRFFSPSDAIRAKVTDVAPIAWINDRHVLIRTRFYGLQWLWVRPSGTSAATAMLKTHRCRPCETPAEYADPNNYHVCISASCVNDEADTCSAQLCQNKYEPVVAGKVSDGRSFLTRRDVPEARLQN